MKTAVVYYSLSGNVRYAAEMIADAVQADLIPLVPVRPYPDHGFRMFFVGGMEATMKRKPKLQPYSFRTDDYDKVVLCTPVWAGTITPPLRTFLADNDLTGKRIAAVLSCGGGDTGKCVERLKEALGTSSLSEVLRLVQPKTDPSDEKDRQILDFAGKLKG